MSAEQKPGTHGADAEGSYLDDPWATPGGGWE